MQAATTITLHALDWRSRPHVSRSAEAESGDVWRRAPSSIPRQAAAWSFRPRFPPVSTGSTFEFTGEIVEKLRGLYRSVKDDQRYAATQFEAADARRAFPCFDEPEYKARFGSHRRGPRRRDGDRQQGDRRGRAARRWPEAGAVQRDPPISSYLVALLVGPFESTPAVRTADGVPVRVWLPPGSPTKAIYARDAHARSVEWLQDYTGDPVPLHQGRRDRHPRLRGRRHGEPRRRSRTATRARRRSRRSVDRHVKGIFSTAAHELTHMWWGDLVTMRWWTDLWLNESFATFVGGRRRPQLNPEWGYWRDFVADSWRVAFSSRRARIDAPDLESRQRAPRRLERFDAITTEGRRRCCG